MEIRLIYSGKNPDHTKACDFVKQFVKDRGILARIVESDKSPSSFEVAVDGCSVVDTEPLYNMTKNKKKNRFPTVKDIARAIERHIWCL